MKKVICFCLIILIISCSALISMRSHSGVRAVFQSLAARLKADDGGDASSVGMILSDAVSSGDNKKINRAFHDAVYGKGRMEDVAPALKAMLASDNAFARYLAARSLFTVGDNGGYETLLNIVKSDTAINGVGKDVRISAAETLGQFRQPGAGNDIYQLYLRTRSGELISPLEELQVSQVSQVVGERGYFPEQPAIVDYGLANARQFIPQLTATFSNTSDQSVKMASAWALATMTNDQGAIGYLVQQAQFGLDNPTQMDNAVERDAMKYLGTIQTPEAKQTLENALCSEDPVTVENAIANLIFNQGGSQAAVQVIASQLSNSAKAKLAWDFTLNMAAQLMDHPEIEAAGQTFARHDTPNDWQLYTQVRKNWPVENWLGNYVLVRKK